MRVTIMLDLLTVGPKFTRPARRAQQQLSIDTFMTLTVILIIIDIPSPTLSFIPDWKPSFSANPSHCSLSFSSSGLTTWFPRLLVLLVAYPFLLFLFYTFQLLVPCGRLSWLMSAHVKIAYRIVSYVAGLRTKPAGRHCCCRSMGQADGRTDTRAF